MGSHGSAVAVPPGRLAVAPQPRPPERLRRLTTPLRRTPGRFTAILAGIVVLGLLTGVVAFVGVRQRADLVRGVTARSGEVAVAAQSLYRALSDADATAASAFLSNGLEPPAMRDRYQRDLADAASALTVVSAAVSSDGRGAAAVARITARLPVYSGLVETARTYNRQGLPLGVAYLQEASGLMRDELLPAAQELYAAASTELDEARDRAAGFPWVAVLLAVLTLAALVLTQIHLTRRTNRLLNVGLLVGTGATLLLVTWLTGSALVAAGNLGDSRDEGSAQVNLLAEARIAGLQARADEALTLVARGNGAAFEENYGVMMERLAGADGEGGLLARARAAAPDDTTRQAVEAAIARSKEWSAAHRNVRALDDSGEYAKAVAATVGTGEQTTAAIFNQLDEALALAITHNGDRFEREAVSAGRALTGVDIGIVGLGLVLLVGVAVGMQRRIAEYR
ncbi:hypothetical protein Pen02_61270 [Plantactinospora endophytica]|uniref:Secreted protein n=1 Tax=Plantactinospora endophytica TaxID=673535 RepID=A0ABQ4E937_9ACTN|nr:hypothetical protein Pen02_61270 [Plantactinospora endophytica]